MPERLGDNDPDKWIYHAHTAVKHRLLAEYLKGWIPILVSGARNANVARTRLMLVDGFAGRGRYAGGEPGSPLVIAGVARELMEYLAQTGRFQGRLEIECAFIEPDPDNFRSLGQEIAGIRATMPSAVILRDPVQALFVDAIGPILADARHHRSSLFVFVDPFGFADVPLTTIREILAIPRAEVFITFMVQFVNRFFGQSDRDRAYASLFGINASQLARVRAALLTDAQREQRIRDYYIERLKAAANAKFCWPFRVMPEQGNATLYYLIHASQHPKALRLMKEKMKGQGTQGEYAFFGQDDFARRAQQLLLNPEDIGQLKEYMLRTLAGRNIEYEAMLNEMAPDPNCYYFIDSHFRNAAVQLRREGKITTTAGTSKTNRGMQGEDILHFPEAVPLQRRLDL